MYAIIGGIIVGIGSMVTACSSGIIGMVAEGTALDELTINGAAVAPLEFLGELYFWMVQAEAGGVEGCSGEGWLGHFRGCR